MTTAAAQQKAKERVAAVLLAELAFERLAVRASAVASLTVQHLARTLPQ